MNLQSLSGKHGLIMALCCLIPFAALFLVMVFNVSLSSLGTLALVLLCPLMHVLMMRGMNHGPKGHTSHHLPEPEKAPALPAKEQQQAP